MKSTTRKGQAAIEFLMTYGWAMMIILVIMGVLWQWGVFDVSNMIKPGQGGFWGVVPYDSKYTSNGQFHIILKNNIDAAITVTQINVSTGVNSGTTGIINNYMGPGDISTTPLVVGGFDQIKSGSGYEVFVTIAYNDSRVAVSSLMSSGRVWGTVE